MKQYSDFQSSSYDLEACSWSNVPDEDFVLQDDKPWVIGEFVWTGFDYLGEPTPYDSWPSQVLILELTIAWVCLGPLLLIPKPLEYQGINPSYLATLELGRMKEKSLPFSYIRTTTVLNFYNGKRHGVQKNMHAPKSLSFNVDGCEI
jgi:hypothetical protein